jgi:heme/copper-type cytochrome/quinol oxidase subunit 3
MTATATATATDDRSVRRGTAVSSGVLGVMFLIFTELMMFAGLISAFVIVKAGAIDGVWPPVGQPRLPVEATAFNTLVLLASGVVMYRASKKFEADVASSKRPLGLAMGLGIFFVLFQGKEWVDLLSQGLTLTHTTYGSFFYLIVGFHGLHAVVAIYAVGLLYFKLTSGKATLSQMHATALFWYFVVGLWPILYWLVYL